MAVRDIKKTKEKKTKKILKVKIKKPKKLLTRVSSREEHLRHQGLSGAESKRLKISAGEKDEDVYSKLGDEDLLENDEIDSHEEGYARGGEAVYKSDKPSSRSKKKKKRNL